MSSVNKVILIGNLGQDPELRTTGSGKSVCNLSIATSNGKKGDEEVTEWHRVTVWEKQADFCNQYLSKGRQVYVEGRIQTRKYEDKEGVTKYATDIVAHTVQFLGSKGDAPSGGGPVRGPGPAPVDPSDNIPF